MKCELDDNSTFALCAVVLFACLACGGMYGCHECESTTREAMEAGLEQTRAPEASWSPPMWSHPVSEDKSK